MVEVRTWKECPKPLPPGVARGWMAMDHGVGVCAIFEIMVGETFMLCYQLAGEPKSRVERFPSFTLAQERAATVLSNGTVIPRLGLTLLANAQARMQ
jgi:hypothetical protein